MKNAVKIKILYFWRLLNLSAVIELKFEKFFEELRN